jgi:hypothetical protein
MRTGIWILSAASLAVLAAGCVEHRVVYVPTYQAPPGYPVATAPAVVAQPPPAPQVEAVPVAPGPEYVWMPGYWSIGIGGGWAWVGGHYGVRPRPHAVWAPGHWGPHARGYVWIGGHWH